MIYDLKNFITVSWDDENKTKEKPVIYFENGAIILDENGEYVICIKSKLHDYYISTMFISKNALEALKQLPNPEPSEEVKHLRRLLKDIYKNK